jgi:hypothetical protein
MSFLVLAGSALSLGFLHGLGADHLMAIAALTVNGRSATGRQARVLPTAVRFAAGHAMLLGVGATVAVAFGWVLPAAIESGAEALGGGLLVLLGVAGLWSLWSGRAYGHMHRIGDAGPRWHLHVGRRDHHPAGEASQVPTLMGAVFAVSSLRMLMLLTPFEADLGGLALPALLALITLFGVGILISMSLFGVVLARVLALRTIERLGHLAGAVVASASILLGVYWILA